MAELLAAQVQADFALYRTYEERITTRAEDTGGHLAAPDQRRGVAQLSRVGPRLGHALPCHAGRPGPRFTHAGQIWSFAGYDPIISETGNSKVQGKISYKGCPYLRATLYYRIGFMAAQHCPACQACYQRALQRHPQPDACADSCCE